MQRINYCPFTVSSSTEGHGPGPDPHTQRDLIRSKARHDADVPKQPGPARPERPQTRSERRRGSRGRGLGAVGWAMIAVVGETL